MVESFLNGRISTSDVSFMKAFQFFFSQTLREDVLLNPSFNMEHFRSAVYHALN